MSASTILRTAPGPVPGATGTLLSPNRAGDPPPRARGAAARSSAWWPSGPRPRPRWKANAPRPTPRPTPSTPRPARPCREARAARSRGARGRRETPAGDHRRGDRGRGQGEGRIRRRQPQDRHRCSTATANTAKNELQPCQERGRRRLRRRPEEGRQGARRRDQADRRHVRAWPTAYRERLAALAADYAKFGLNPEPPAADARIVRRSSTIPATSCSPGSPGWRPRSSCSRV